MPDANELVNTLKRAAVEAVEAGKPVNVYFGEVVSASPLKINVEHFAYTHLTLQTTGLV